MEAIPVAPKAESNAASKVGVPANGSPSAAVLELLKLLVGAGGFLDLEADLGAGIGRVGAAAALVVREEEPVRPWSMAFWMALSKLDSLLAPNDDAVVVVSPSSPSEVLMQVELAVSKVVALVLTSNPKALARYAGSPSGTGWPDSCWAVRILLAAAPYRPKEEDEASRRNRAEAILLFIPDPFLPLLLYMLLPRGCGCCFCWR